MAMRKPGTSGAAIGRYRMTRGAFKATTALFGMPGARALAAAALVTTATIMPAWADDWTAFVNDDWFLGGNWADGSTPTAADNATVDAGGSRPAIINAAPGTAYSVFVGEAGTGVLTIQKGGSLADDHGYIGLDAGSMGHATVTDAGSKWTNTGDLSIGGNGAINATGIGTLDIENGGTVSDTNGMIANSFDPVNTAGTATINGAGSRWMNSAGLFVAYKGNGTLTIENKGAASDNNGYIAYESGSKGTAAVTGAGSTWKNNSTLYVGYFGDGTLTIEKGGAVSDSNGAIAAGVLGTGAVTVKDAGSKWSNILAVYIGEQGIGTLTVEDGGAVSDSYGFVGNGIDTAGTATVMGVGSTWKNFNDLSISGGVVIGGTLMGGKLMVENGGVVSDLNGIIGDNAGAFGTATVEGAGSKWTNSIDLSVQGNARLMIKDGGAVSDVDGSIGKAAGVESFATVTGAGSKWANSGKLSIGGLAHYSTLTIEDGGAVSNTDGIIGGTAGSTNTASVTGSGSTWANSGDLSVGKSGYGSLDIEDGGAVSDVNGSISANAGSTGVAFVIGAGTLWTNTGNLSVGEAGIGGLGIEDGGTVSDVNGSIGVNAGSTGLAAVSGAGSKWMNSGDFIVGYSGAGTLGIKAGGTISNADGYIGGIAASSGTATVADTGSKWVNSGNLFIGYAGTGTLNVKDGGAVDDVNTAIGYLPGSNSKATISGAGSNWKSAGTLFVGYSGAGALSIEGGGTVGDSTGFIGANTGSTGTATVSGAGSQWLNSGGLGVGGGLGGAGTGTLTIENGGTVSDVDGAIGVTAGSTGNATVTDSGSKWVNSNDLYVGSTGTGVLLIQDGGVVDDVNTAIGYSPGSRGKATISGSGSKWTSAGMFFVGNSGVGVLTVKNGGLVGDAQSGIGVSTGSVGEATVTDAGSKWANSAILVGGAGTGTLTVTHGGTVAASAVTEIGLSPGSQGTLNIGAASGDPATAPGTLATPTVIFGAGTGALVFNHTSSAYSFAPVLTGKGAVDAVSGTTLLTGASGAFTGTTTVANGATLGLDGTLGGTLHVLAGGRLEGTGTAATTTVAGTIAPGHSIGTLHVSGNYTQAPGSTYQVEINSAGHSDLVEVAGAATLNGGTVDVVPYPDYAIATPYTILRAAGGVTGTFAGVSHPYISAFLAPKLSYDPNHAYLTIAQSASFASAALTPNEKAAAKGADSTGPGNPVWNAIALLPSVSDAPAAFDAISGEIHASIKSGLVDDSRFIRDAVIGRLRGAFAGDPGIVLSGNKKGDPLPVPDGRLGLWTHGFGSSGQWGGDGNAATLDRTIAGIFIGGDAAVTDEWRLGLAAGYSRSSLDVDGRASSANVDNYTIAAYGGGRIGGLGLRFGAANTWHSIDTSRSIAFPGFADIASASYDARTTQVFGDVGYTIKTGRANFEPFADLAYVNLHTDGYAESGYAGLTAGSDNTDVTYMTLGLRAAAGFDFGGMKASVHGTLGWRHAFGDTTPFATQAFAGGTAFSVAGVPVSEDAAIVQAGLDFNLTRAATLRLSYVGQIGDGVTDQGANAALSVTF